jgi:hypothetical protein
MTGAPARRVPQRHNHEREAALATELGPTQRLPPLGAYRKFERRQL